MDDIKYKEGGEKTFIVRSLEDMAGQVIKGGLTVKEQTDIIAAS